jgi:hypothetical protein
MTDGRLFVPPTKEIVQSLLSSDRFVTRRIAINVPADAQPALKKLFVIVFEISAFLEC